MQVAVEHAVDHGALHQRDHRRAHHLLGVDAGFFHADHVVEVEPLQSLHDQHPTRGQRGMRPRNDVARLAQLAEHAGDIDHVGGLHAEVQFFHDGFGEQFHQRRWVRQRGDRDAADQVRRQPSHDAQVLAHEQGDAGSLDFHDHLLARSQCGRVHLSDGRRRQGRGIEPREHVVETAAQVGLNHGTNIVEGLGRYLIATQLELGHELGREQAFATGDDLAEFDVRRPQTLGCPAQPFRDLGPAGLGRGVSTSTLARQPRQNRTAEDRDHRHDSSTWRDPSRLGEMRNLGPRRAAQALGQRQPPDVRPFEHPRCFVGEGAPLAIGGPGGAGRVGRRAMRLDG